MGTVNRSMGTTGLPAQKAKYPHVDVEFDSPTSYSTKVAPHSTPLAFAILMPALAGVGALIGFLGARSSSPALVGAALAKSTLICGAVGLALGAGAAEIINWRSLHPNDDVHPLKANVDFSRDKADGIRGPDKSELPGWVDGISGTIGGSLGQVIPTGSSEANAVEHSGTYSTTGSRGLGALVTDTGRYAITGSMGRSKTESTSKSLTTTTTFDFAQSSQPFVLAERSSPKGAYATVDDAIRAQYRDPEPQRHHGPKKHGDKKAAQEQSAAATVLAIVKDGDGYATYKLDVQDSSSVSAFQGADEMLINDPRIEGLVVGKNTFKPVASAVDRVTGQDANIFEFSGTIRGIDSGSVSGNRVTFEEFSPEGDYGWSADSSEAPILRKDPRNQFGSLKAASTYASLQPEGTAIFEHKNGTFEVVRMPSRYSPLGASLNDQRDAILNLRLPAPSADGKFVAVRVGSDAYSVALDGSVGVIGRTSFTIHPDSPDTVPAGVKVTGIDH